MGRERAQYWQVSATSDGTLSLTIEFSEDEILDGETLAEMRKYECVCTKCGQQYVLTKYAFDNRNATSTPEHYPHCSKCNSESVVIRQKS